MLIIELMLLAALLVFWYTAFWAGAKYGTLKTAWAEIIKFFSKST